MVCTFISPFQEDRRFVRGILPDGAFFEVFVKCDLEVCKRRDPKGLYAKALAGEIKDFTGIGSPYEEPERRRSRSRLTWRASRRWSPGSTPTCRSRGSSDRAAAAGTASVRRLRFNGDPIRIYDLVDIPSEKRLQVKTPKYPWEI